MRLRLSSSLRVLAVVSPLVLIGLGGYGAVRGGLSSPGGVLLVAGIVLAAVVAWTVPWSSEIDAGGVHWRSLVRVREIEWDDVVAVERHRRRPDGPLVLRTIEHGKLALTDVVERPAEWDALRELVQMHAPGAAFPDPPPSHPFHRS